MTALHLKGWILPATLLLSLGAPAMRPISTGAHIDDTTITRRSRPS